MANKNKQQNEDPFKDLVDLNDLAGRLRKQNSKCHLILLIMALGKHAYRMVFKDLGKQDNNRDTLYFNAFTEDLFFWDNDLVNDTDRVLVLNDSSTFFAGIWVLELDNRIRPLLQKYVDFVSG